MGALQDMCNNSAGSLIHLLPHTQNAMSSPSPSPGSSAALFLLPSFKGNKLTLAQPPWHVPVPPSLPGGTEQPVQCFWKAPICSPPVLPWLWAAGYNRHCLRWVPGLRIQRDHRSVCKYHSGRVQPFGMRKRKINATSPLRATGTLHLSNCTS